MKQVHKTAAVFALAAHVTWAWAHETGGPNGTSGAPSQSTCAQSGCHSQFPVNSGPGIFHILAPHWFVIPEGACPDTAEIRIHVIHEGMSRWGFQLTTLDTSGSPMGHMHAVDTSLSHKSVDSAGQEYVTQTVAGTFAGQEDSSGYWWIHWIPAEQLIPSPLKLYVSAVASNNDGTPGGDFVYAYSLDVVPVYVDCGISITGDVNQSSTLTSADIIYLVNYVFKSGPPPVSWGPIVGDVNCDGADTASDIIRLVNYVFKGGIPPCNVCSECCMVTEESWFCP